MGAATLIFVALAFRVPRSKRIFHYITAAITMVATIAYFTMGSNLGYAAVPVEFVRSNPKVAGTAREIFYVRYIDWFVTTPVSHFSTTSHISDTNTHQLLLLDIMLTAGLPWPTILYTLLLDEIMIITGLVGALVESRYKWGYFVFAMAALFYIAYNITWVGRKHANALGSSIGRTYLMVGAWTIFLWFLYPIAWGLSEGGNVISPDSEAVFYGVLDLLAKPVFGALLLWGHRNIDPATLGLHIRDYDDAMHPTEKSGFGSAAAANNSATGGVTGANTAGVNTAGVNNDATATTAV
jgi:bacteriorhodopsin